MIIDSPHPNEFQANSWYVSSFMKYVFDGYNPGLNKKFYLSNK